MLWISPLKPSATVNNYLSLCVVSNCLQWVPCSPLIRVAMALQVSLWSESVVSHCVCLPPCMLYNFLWILLRPVSFLATITIVSTVWASLVFPGVPCALLLVCPVVTLPVLGFILPVGLSRRICLVLQSTSRTLSSVPLYLVFHSWYVSSLASVLSSCVNCCSIGIVIASSSSSCLPIFHDPHPLMVLFHSTVYNYIIFYLCDPF